MAILDITTCCHSNGSLGFQVKVLEGSLAAQRADPNSLAALIQVSPPPTTLTTPSVGLLLPDKRVHCTLLVDDRLSKQALYPETDAWAGRPREKSLACGQSGIRTGAHHTIETVFVSSSFSCFGRVPICPPAAHFAPADLLMSSNRAPLVTPRLCAMCFAGYSRPGGRGDHGHAS
jgi:hypothetical protein